MKKALLTHTVLLCAFSLMPISVNACRGCAGKELTKIFNEAAGAIRRVDPPPVRKLEYTPPSSNFDAEKIMIKDVDVMRATLPAPRATPDVPSP